jgi:adenylylsulfate kinase
MTGQVIWITGLSGAGKTTLASAVARQLRQSKLPVVVLDGDVLREVFGEIHSHGRDARLALSLKYAHLSRTIANQGITVLIATISLFREVHIWNRENLPLYFEVFLDVSIDELRRRDSKGLYRAFDAGEIHNVAGLDLSIDYPDNPDFKIDDSCIISIEDLASKLIERLNSKGGKCVS